MLYDLIYIPLGSAGMGGAERSLLELSAEMSRRGKRVLILAERALQGTGFEAEAAAAGLPVDWVDWSPEKGLFTNLAALARVFARYRTRVIHFNISWRRHMWLAPVIARMLSRARLLGTMRAMPDPHHLTPRRRYFGVIPGLQLWHLPELVAGWIWARFLALTVSINGRDFPHRLTQHYGFSSDKIRVIFNGIKLRPHILSAEEKHSIRAHHGFGPDDIVLCYAGRLSAEKGIQYLLQALVRLPDNYQLLIVGDGPQRGELETMARELGITARVQFLGFLSTPSDTIASSDIVIVPSLWYEAFGRVVVEAMGEGVPVVASRIGGMAELFTHGVEGRYVEAANAQDLAAAIEAMGSDRSALHAMGERARALVAQKYSLGRVTQQYAEVYDELLPD